jgi:hypothetical protein
LEKFRPIPGRIGQFRSLDFPTRFDSDSRRLHHNESILPLLFSGFAVDTRWIHREAE